MFDLLKIAKNMMNSVNMVNATALGNKEATANSLY
jgi:hypothetical protein